MKCDPAPTDRINSFSLVSYIPGRLGEFVTRLRRELVAGCVAQSHVTILPPRPLFVEVAEAEQALREKVSGLSPLVVSVPRIHCFDQTCVVYADIGLGSNELHHMHEMLNTDELYYNEPFPYHPHITLAQGFRAEELHRMYQLACKRWQEEAPTTSFVIESLTFVQNTVANRWIDLAECEMRGQAAIPA